DPHGSALSEKASCADEGAFLPSSTLHRRTGGAARMKFVRLVIVSLALCIAPSSAQAVAAASPAAPCIAKDTGNLTPSMTAPSWYVPGVTGPCVAASDPVVSLLTAYWTYFARGASDAWRTVPYNADVPARARRAAIVVALQLPPLRLQRRLVSALGMRVAKPYRCAAICRDDVEIPGTRVRLGFDRVRGEPPYLVLYESG